MTTEKEIEQQKRAKLKKEKPQVFEKVIKIEERFRRGIPTPIIDIAYSYACNLKCKHCTASRFKKEGRILSPRDLLTISNQAHALGLCQFCISGGEPLIFKDLDDVIRALQPDKFHLTMSTNGHFMTLGQFRGDLHDALSRPRPGVLQYQRFSSPDGLAHVLIVDDMIDTAGTLAKSAEALTRKGAVKVYACCSHGVFAENAVSKICAAPIEQVVTTDSIPLPPAARGCEKIHVLSVGKLLAQAIRSIHEETSVSKLFI